MKSRSCDGVCMGGVVGHVMRWVWSDGISLACIATPTLLCV